MSRSPTISEITAHARAHGLGHNGGAWWAVHDSDGELLATVALTVREGVVYWRMFGTGIWHPWNTAQAALRYGTEWTPRDRAGNPTVTERAAVVAYLRSCYLDETPPDLDSMADAIERGDYLA